MRARITIDVTKPLCRGLRVFTNEVVGSVSIPVQYEFLPEFCFRCSIIGHKLRECPKEETLDTNGCPVKHRFGDWLRAMNIKQWRRERRDQKKGHQWSDHNSPMRSSGNRGGTNNGGLDEMGATLNSDNEIDRGAMAETRKRWDYSTDNSLGNFTDGEDAIGSNKRNTRGDLRAQQDTDRVPHLDRPGSLFLTQKR
ncbi:Zinc finger, CCHC-type [Trema orientale]|uniref:Zinc finger, CCHC-type n=1 Tax=Trema orientale TaxID=63057 RepID=A0A2P5BP79_TREOI|nr:Zinc finger, CCHC-type [Trema orientale]